MMLESPLTFAENYAKSRIALFGAPFDGTVCYRPGARFGPNSIRGEFYGVEPYSPYQDKDMESVSVFDCGDLDLPFGNTGRALKMIEDFVEKLCGEDKLPFMIGGEHLVTLGAVRALRRKYADLAVIQLDAHADLMDAYMGEELSHAAVMRRIWELVSDGKIYQFGIRSGKKFEFEFAKKHNHIQKFNFGGLKAAADALGNTPVYLTVDLDVLDPSILPGTGTPEAGGVSFQELLNAILGLSRLNIVGCDMVELSPIYDPSGVSTAVACKLLREMLLML
ncbi:MAG: agmatinase [Clostridiales bacterium]|jgi:agmatinase|nr:agmatinase [Clostridiales bacterium]